MKTGTILETDRLIIRPWTLSEEDREFFHRVDSDEQMMHFFPWRSTRQEANEKLKLLCKSGEETGLSWAVTSLKDTGERIGFTGLKHATFDAHFTPAVEIGWRYTPEHWGKGYAVEAARELLRQGFEDVGLADIVSFAVVKNTPSIKVMERIGMTEDRTSPFDFKNVPDSHPDLKSHVLYRITREQWRTLQG